MSSRWSLYKSSLGFCQSLHKSLAKSNSATWLLCCNKFSVNCDLRHHWVGLLHDCAIFTQNVFCLQKPPVILHSFCCCAASCSDTVSLTHLALHRPTLLLPALFCRMCQLSSVQLSATQCNAAEHNPAQLSAAQHSEGH